MHTVFSLLSNTDRTTPGTYTNLGIPVDLPNIFCRIGKNYEMVGGIKAGLAEPVINILCALFLSYVPMCFSTHRYIGGNKDT